MESIVASSAFEREALRSERIRVFGILSVLGVVWLFFLGRVLFLGGPAELRLFLLFLVLLVACCRQRLPRFPGSTLPAGVPQVSTGVSILLGL